MTMRLLNKYYWKYDVYNFFRRDLWKFFANIWRFRKELYDHAWWDYHFTLQMMYRSISIMEKGMKNGYEVPESRDKKIEKMKRVLFLLESNLNDSYVELAEKELGSKVIYRGFDFIEIDMKDSNGDPLYELDDKLTDEEKELNSLIYSKAREIEELHWSELWEILKGSKNSLNLHQLGNQLSVEDETDPSSTDWKDRTSKYYEKFDGTDMRGWWD